MQTPHYLIKVDCERNENKYYRMIPEDGRWRAEWGRIGNLPNVATYPMDTWEQKYQEKIRKGYLDKTDLHVKHGMEIPGIDAIKGKKVKPFEDPAIEDMVKRLLDCAKATVTKNYTVASDEVTQVMVDSAQKAIKNLYFATAVPQFNKALQELFLIIPRKMRTVDEYLAHTIKDYKAILEREQGLLDVMEGQVQSNRARHELGYGPEQSGQTLFDALGILIRPIEDRDRAIIRRKLKDSDQKFKNAWRITNLKSQKKFDAYLDDHKEHGNRPRVKLMWHGSRSENWFNILNTGLVLRPEHATITGKMFGEGLYFAPRAQKSMGYTSLLGSYWAKGKEPSAFLGLYAISYERPHNVYDDDIAYRSLNYDSFQKLSNGAHCMHVHAGTVLKNDEVIVYREDQCTIQYLVEITS